MFTGKKPRDLNQPIVTKHILQQLEDEIKTEKIQLEFYHKKTMTILASVKEKMVKLEILKADYKPESEEHADHKQALPFYLRSKSTSSLPKVSQPASARVPNKIKSSATRRLSDNLNSLQKEWINQKLQMDQKNSARNLKNANISNSSNGSKPINRK